MLHISESKMTNCDTMPKYLVSNYKKYFDKKVALLKKDFGIWRSLTWKEYYEQVEDVCLGLVSLGLKRGDKVTIIGDNDPELWIISIAVQAAGGVVVVCYIDIVPSELQYLVDNSDSVFVAAGDQEQCDKILKVKDQLTNLKKVVFWDTKGMWKYDDPILISYRNLMELGKKCGEANQGIFTQLIEQGKADDIAIYCYTSGTTGLPKGSMLSHHNLIESVNSAHAFNPFDARDNYLSFLSPAWITEQVYGMCAPLVYGFKVYFPEEAETVQLDIREVAPQIVFYGPRQLESLAHEVQVRIVETSALKRFIYNLFLPVGIRKGEMDYEQKHPHPLFSLLYSIGNLLVFRPLKDKYGLLKCRIAVTGGSLLSPDLFKYFHGLGIPLRNIYGLSESPGSNCQTLIDVKAESSGRPVVNVEERITSDNELVLRAPQMFNGYYKNEKATKEKFYAGGWLATGDAGYFDDDGHFYYWERVSDLSTLNNGVRFSPSNIESRMKFSPYIMDVMILGDNREYVSAIVIIDYENVSKWAEKRRINFTTFADLSQRPEVIKMVEETIQKINRSLPTATRVAKFVNLHKEFDPDDAELTRTRKLRRSFVEDRFADIIEAIYAGKDKFNMRAEVRYRDGKTAIVENSLSIRNVILEDKK